MLLIGEKEFTTKQLNAKFPIEFYKNTGIDVFGIDKLIAEGKLIDMYETLLNLAFYMVEFDGTFDEFAEEVTMPEILASAEEILSIFNNGSNPKSKSANNSKK